MHLFRCDNIYKLTSDYLGRNVCVNKIQLFTF